MLKRLLSILILLLSFSFIGCSEEEPKKDINQIYQIVQEYYRDIEIGKYSEALDYIDYSNDNTKESDEAWLNQNKSKYSIKYWKEGTLVGCEYSSKENLYRIISAITIDDKINNIYKSVNESVYLKNINGKYMIVHIASSDLQVGNRSSSNSSDWTTTSDQEYHAIQ